MGAGFRVDVPMLTAREPETWNGWAHGIVGKHEAISELRRRRLSALLRRGYANVDAALHSVQWPEKERGHLESFRQVR